MAGAPHSGPDALVDSNSTRTESYVAIRPDPEGPHAGRCPRLRITHPDLGMGAGLKMLDALPGSGMAGWR